MPSLDLTEFDEAEGTRLRAAAAALALALLGRKVTVSAVAAASGVSRQALHQGHPAVLRLINDLQVAPPAPLTAAPAASSLPSAREGLERERSLRRQAEEERDRALHHLELASATVASLKRHAGKVSDIDQQRRKRR